MANIKVSEMTQADSVNDIDLLMIVQGSTNKKVTKQTLMKNINTEITNIKSEQATQNTKIQANTTAIETKASQSDLDAVEADIQTNRANITALQTENNNLRKALPQIKGTGTYITLNNTSDNKFNELVVKGNTEQEQLSGKNKFNQEAVTKLIKNGTSSTTGINNSNDIITVTYTNGQNGRYAMDYLMPITSGKVSISFKALLTGTNDGKGILVGIYNSDGSVETTTAIQLTATSKDSWYNYTATFTLNENAENGINLDIQAWNSGNTIQLKDIQVEESSTATNFEPYCGGIPSPNPDYPQAIKNVTGNVNVKIQNKNMFNLTAQDFKNGTIVGFASKVFLGGLKPNTIYICSTNDTAQLGSSTTNLLFGGASSIANGVNISSPKTATSNENGEVEILLRTTNIDNFLNNYWVQIEEGSTATSYVPHQEQNLPFTLGTQRMYQGSYLADDGKHHIRKQIVLDGSNDEGWSNYNNANLIYSTNIFENIIREISTGERTVGLCNYSIIYGFNARKPGYFYFHPNKDFIFYNNKTYFNSLSEFKQFLSAHNLIVEIEIAEEWIEPYNATQQTQYNAIKEAISYYEQTNISSTSNEISAIIEANAVGDLNLILS